MKRNCRQAATLLFGMEVVPMMAEGLQIRPGIGLVIRDDRERLLLHRRRIGSGWAPVSGRVEPGETIESAAHREAMEETGLAIRIERFVGVYSRPEEQVVEFPDGRRIHFITAVVAVHAVEGQLTGSSEGYEWGWFAADQFPSPMLQYAKTWLADAMSGSLTVLR